MLMLTLALMPTRTLTLTHRKETTLSLCLGTSHQQVSPQWHFTHCASTAPDPNTGPVDHGQSIDFPRWHFTHRESPSLCLCTPHQKVSSQWHLTHCGRTAPGPKTVPDTHRQSRGFPRWHLTRRKSPSLCLGTPQQEVSPRWHFTHCAKAVLGSNTGPVAHGQSRGFSRWHFTHRKSPSLCLGTPNTPDFPHWHFTHLAGTTPCLGPRDCLLCLESWRFFTCFRMSHLGVKRNFGLCSVDSCPSSAYFRILSGTGTMLVRTVEPLRCTRPSIAHPPCGCTASSFSTHVHVSGAHTLTVTFSGAPGGRLVVLAYSRPNAACLCPEPLQTRAALQHTLSRVAGRVCVCCRTSSTLQPAPVRCVRACVAELPTSTVGLCLSPATVAPVSPDGSSYSCPHGCGHSWKVGCGQSRPAPYSIPPGALSKTNGACTVCARKQPGCLLSSAGSMANPPRTCPSTDRERLAPPQHALSSESSSGQPLGAVFRRAPGIVFKGSLRPPRAPAP